MPSSNNLALHVQNLRLVSSLPKQELFEPCSADARSLDPCHAGQTLNVTLRIHGSDTMALKLIGFDPETQLSHQRPGFFWRQTIQDFARRLSVEGRVMWERFSSSDCSAIIREPKRVS